ncbi:NAD(P)-binding protein [Decorospora gaudefroyi]|uniref:NAD(P)-binding protein n=1 Tax=Decorospora gaudefroyi TaxID=184978 RepID=A0A6A5KKC8_9PLEO|nr:NAD(P)-binding protein [Decorospora gaudefroyi]
MSTNMRVAIAGTCGLALLIAREINESTSHQLVILSRTHQTSLIASGYNCQAVDYNNPASLQHALLGVDTVISTVMGSPQLRLIEAAVQCRVRRFAPAEFEGQPGLRGQNGLLDRGRNSALALLQYYRSNIQSTVFVCGILYERFSVNGIMSHRIGVNTGYGNEGDFIVDARQMTSMAPIYDSAHNPSWICLTSAYDVAQFVVRAVDMPTWPSEMSMCGERMTVNALVELIRACRNRPWASIDYQDPGNLEYQMTMAQLGGDTAGQRRLALLLATAEGRYDFVVPAYLNSIYPDVHVTRFRDWFLRNWASIP